MADIGNIKPPGPVWPQPSVEKVKRKEEQAEQRRQQQRNTPSHKDDEQDGGGIDEYV